ncbi:MAG: Cache 3/Cache 2 fusion domain-containing protein, partial [Desulfovibrionales bacterium]|nr:Cache 3/Cache 2 fusion domain-containing protein [Desulfovibrionales bacterium]
MGLKNIKLGVKLVVGGLLAALIPVIILGSISVKTSSDAIHKTSRNKSAQLVKDFTQLTEMIMARELGFMKTIAVSPLVSKAVSRGFQNDLEPLNAYLKATLGNVEGMYDHIFIVDTQGRIQCDSHDGMAKKQKIRVDGREYFKAAMEGKRVVGPALRSKLSSKPVVVAAVPVTDGSGRVGGCVIGAIDLKALAKRITDNRIGKTGYVFMTNAEGIIVIHPKNEYILELDLNHVKGMEEINRQMMANKTGVQEYHFKGTDKISAFSYSPTTQWSVAVTEDMDEFMAPVRKLIKYTLGITAMATLLVGGILLFSSRQMVRPIEEAVRNLEDIADG